MDTSAIIVAAGYGNRFERDEPKQFVELHSRPALMHSVEVLAALERLQHLVVVLPPDHIERGKTLVRSADLDVRTTLVPGGATRYESVQTGLRETRSDDTVLVHDGARPGVTRALCTKLLNVYSERSGLDGVIPVVSVDDTAKEINPDDRVVRSTVDREILRGAQTPQLFHSKYLRSAVDAWDNPGPPTDESQLMENAGYTVGYVDGLPRCRKITYPEDLRIVEHLMEASDDGV